MIAHATTPPQQVVYIAGGYYVVSVVDGAGQTITIHGHAANYSVAPKWIGKAGEIERIAAKLDAGLPEKKQPEIDRVPRVWPAVEPEEVAWSPPIGKIEPTAWHLARPPPCTRVSAGQVVSHLAGLLITKPAHEETRPMIATIYARCQGSRAAELYTKTFMMPETRMDTITNVDKSIVITVDRYAIVTDEIATGPAKVQIHGVLRDPQPTAEQMLAAGWTRFES